MFSVAAHAYPTFCRSTGVGWSLAVARFGGIVSSFAGAAFFAMGMRPRHFFFFIAGMQKLTFISVVALRRHSSDSTRNIKMNNKQVALAVVPGAHGGGCASPEAPAQLTEARVTEQSSAHYRAVAAERRVAWRIRSATARG
jgi:hypothetical protein